MVQRCGDDTARWEIFLWITTQGFPQTYRTATLDREQREVGVYPVGGSDGRVRIIGGADLRIILQYTVTYLIESRTIMDLFLPSERHQG